MRGSSCGEGEGGRGEVGGCVNKKVEGGGGERGEGREGGKKIKIKTYSGAQGEVAAEAHARGADAARAGGQAEEVVDGRAGVAVVGRERLGGLVRVAPVGAGDVVGQGLRAREVVVRARRGDDVAVAGELAGEAGDGARDLVDLAEEDDAREARARVLRDGRVEEEDAHGAAACGGAAAVAVAVDGHVGVGFLDQHGWETFWGGVGRV